MKTVDIIVPLLNEEKNIPAFYKAAQNICAQSMNKINYTVIFVDDGSTDQSWRAIQALVKQDMSVTGVRFVRNFGKEYAIEAGLRKSTGDAAIVIDADLQHPISLIPKMVSQWRSGTAKVISAVKAKRQKEFFLKRHMTKSYYWVFKKLSGLHMQDASDYKLIDRDVINAYLSLPEGDRFFRGLIGWLGFAEEKIPFTPDDRQEGESSWSLKQLYVYAKSSVISFSYAPLRLIRALSWLMFYFSLILGVQTILNNMFGNAAAGFTTVILVQLIVGCIVMFSLSFIGTYISKIDTALKRRPHYIILEEI